MCLDGGCYGNLVKQMFCVLLLLVQLVEVGQYVVLGEVYVLVDDIGVCVVSDGLYFQSDVNGILFVLLLVEYIVLVLFSGVDLVYVGLVLDLVVVGVWVVGQVGEGCYDLVVVIVVVVVGMVVGELQELVQVIVVCWGEQDDNGEVL